MKSFQHLVRRAIMPSFESASRAVERSTDFLAVSSQVDARWRVLIVNAHTSIREMIRIVLETHSDLIEVVCEASNGEEAIAQAQSTPVDLVLMDIHLSAMSSMEASRQMRRILPHAVIVGIASEYSPFLYNSMIAEGAVAFVRTEDTADLLFRTIVFAMCAYHPSHVHSTSVHAAAV
jgi:DNA-binding NarL/FixJ family response regulator